SAAASSLHYQSNQLRRLHSQYSYCHHARHVEGRSFTSVCHLSLLLLLLVVVVVVVKRSSGKGCITTSCNENSATYHIGYDMLSANDSIYSLPCKIGRASGRERGVDLGGR